MLKALAITLLTAMLMTSGIAFGPIGDSGFKQTVVVSPGKADREDYSKS